MKCQECSKTGGKKSMDAAGDIHVLCRKCLLTILGHYIEPDHTCSVCRRRKKDGE